MPFDCRAAFKTPDPFESSACQNARTHPMMRPTVPHDWPDRRLDRLIMKRLVASCDRRDAGWGSYRRGQGDHTARADRQIVAPWWWLGRSADGEISAFVWGVTPIGLWSFVKQNGSTEIPCRLASILPR